MTDRHQGRLPRNLEEVIPSAGACAIRATIHQVLPDRDLRRSRTRGAQRFERLQRVVILELLSIGLDLLQLHVHPLLLEDGDLWCLLPALEVTARQGLRNPWLIDAQGALRLVTAQE